MSLCINRLEERHETYNSGCGRDWWNAGHSLWLRSVKRSPWLSGERNWANILRPLLLSGRTAHYSEGQVVADVAEPTDVLWITTKTYQLEDALQSIVNVPPAIMPLLNGMDHIAVLRARYGDDRIIPATIAVEAERTADGHYVQRSPVRLEYCCER